MLAKIRTGSCSGIEGKTVTVETDLTRGLPGFFVVGLPDTAIREAGQRIKSAIRNSGFEYPMNRIVINLVPAYLHTKGSHYDLAMAMGILRSAGILTGRKTEEMLLQSGFLGELRVFFCLAVRIKVLSGWGLGRRNGRVGTADRQQVGPGTARWRPVNRPLTPQTALDSGRFVCPSKYITWIRVLSG